LQKLKGGVGREIARVSRKELSHVPTDFFPGNSKLAFQPEVGISRLFYE
jgi:hypothetical protein